MKRQGGNAGPRRKNPGVETGATDSRMSKAEDGELVARFVHRGRGRELQVLHDGEAPDPLAQDHGFVLIGRRSTRGAFGDEQVDSERYTWRLQIERDEGRTVVAVVRNDDGDLRLDEATDPESEAAAGTAVFETDDSESGVSAQRRENANGVLARYDAWCAGATYRYVMVERERCQHCNSVLRNGRTVGAEGGFIGENYEDSGLLEAAGIREPDGGGALVSGWTESQDTDATTPST